MGPELGIQELPGFGLVGFDHFTHFSRVELAVGPRQPIERRRVHDASRPG